MTDKRPPDLSTDELAAQLWLSVVGDSAGLEAPAKASKAACAAFAREERMQFHFVVFYQTLVAVLALLALLLLIVAGYLLLREPPRNVEALLSGVGTLVASGGALFLTRQRKDARKMLAAAQKNLNDGQCR
jgi:uncharacterized BrkB/YihY/UPF0761 family membrane protein